ncbi:hypothetical protein CYMTET_43823 [Cymbomonas tetramitiformis]|uniref:Uncharacterized protein n=1 Tax=Cymbomonas tetramitiformis TaxID=36881 RepID=A0AAE0C1E7_9CHLO|nr:hypothetical protein CYMTET_43823 [Cymbomonas tetramitiformis]
MQSERRSKYKRAQNLRRASIQFSLDKRRGAPTSQPSRETTRIKAVAASSPQNAPVLVPTVTVVNDRKQTLECIAHRAFEVEELGEVMLLEPLDCPVQVLRGEGAPDEECCGDLTDEELDAILGDLTAALAKGRLRLSRSAHCLTGDLLRPCTIPQQEFRCTLSLGKFV